MLAWRLAAGLLLSAVPLATVLAQGSASPGDDAPRARLAAAKVAAAAATVRAQRLAAQAARETGAAARARADLAAADARVGAAEAALAVGRARLAAVNERLIAARAGLAAREGPIVRLIAGLQALGRRPAALALVQPGSTADLVHTRATLAGLVPVIRARTEGLRQRLAAARGAERSADVATRALTADRRTLEEERLAAARLAATHDGRAVRYGRAALRESDRAIALGETARDAADAADQAVDAAAAGRRLAALAPPAGRPTERNEGALPWARRDAPYILPVAGALITGFGEVSPSGVRSRGLTLAPAAGAAVVAPAAGRVIFVGPFRGYGRIVVIDHGGAWTTLVTGLAASRLRLDQIVVQGQPIGTAGTGDRPLVTVELRRRGRAVDFVPLIG